MTKLMTSALLLATLLMNGCVFSEQGEFQPSRALVGMAIGAASALNGGGLGMGLVSAGCGGLTGPPQAKTDWSLPNQHNPSF